MRGDAALAELARLYQQGLYADTAARSRAMVEREPGNVGAWRILGAALLAQGRAKDGVACLRKVCELRPDSVDDCTRLADVLAGTGDLHGAADGYRRAVALNSSDIRLPEQLAALLKVLARYDEAEAVCRAALAGGPATPSLRHTLANVLFEQGRVNEAIAEVRSVLATAPDLPAAHSDLLRMLNYADGQDPESVWSEHAAWDLRHARALELAALPHANDRNTARRLRLGYVSPHFRKHAMTFFFESTLRHHDREQFEVFLYADVAQPDEYSARLQSLGAVWRNTTDASDESLAAMVRSDAIDILVDLSGHTPRNRLLAFARRAAPVQVTWNGYPNTTGMRSMNYRVTDAICDPPGTTEHLHSETLVRLPDIYMTWQPPTDAPDPGPPPSLSRGHVTFGSFNSCFKITPATIALWARILRGLPGSRLMLLTADGEAAKQRIWNLFAAREVAHDRLEILPRLTHEQFLAAHLQADVALDTFPYHGTTTTCFSLWMGLPVVVRAGDVHAARVGASLMGNVGLAHLIARNDSEYVEIALRTAADLPALAALRTGLRGRVARSALANGASGARGLEQAYRNMWSAWCRT